MYRRGSRSMPIGLLVCLSVLGCGGGGPGQVGPPDGDAGATRAKSAGIPPPGTVLATRSAASSALLAGSSRLADTSLTLGGLLSVTAPTAGTVSPGRVSWAPCTTLKWERMRRMETFRSAGS